jgi:hypothetical protein
VFIAPPAAGQVDWERGEGEEAKTVQWYQFAPFLAPWEAQVDTHRKTIIMNTTHIPSLGYIISMFGIKPYSLKYKFREIFTF